MCPALIEGDVNKSRDAKSNTADTLTKAVTQRKLMEAIKLLSVDVGVNSKEGASQAATAEILAAVATPTTAERKQLSQLV